MKRVLLVVLGAATLWGCGQVTQPAASPDSDDQVGVAPLSAEAVKQMELVLAEKRSRTPAQRKISSQLLYAKNGMPAGVGGAKGASLKSLLPTDEAGRVLVVIKGAVSASRLESLGGRLVVATPGHGSTRAWMKLESLETIATDGSVQSIRPAMQASTGRSDWTRGMSKLRSLSRAERVDALKVSLRQALAVARPGAPDALPIATNVGAKTSEGDHAHGADRARKFFNVDGTGVKIGVLSDSDDFKEESIATGDLPPDTVTVPGQSGRPGAGEGTAMMQIVHDLAPGAKLFFATAFNSPESFADNIRILRDVYGCDIIVDDIIYFFESPYTDDIIAQAVNDVTADGAMYFSSAGNEGNFNDGTSGTWEGDFKNGGTLSTLPSGYVVHDFGDKVISNLIELGGGPPILHWSDFGTLDDPRSGNDYDLFVMTPDLREVVVASTDIQDGTGLPFEFIGFTVPAGFRIVVAKHAEAARRAIRVEHFRGELGLSTPGATYGHNSANATIGTAAVDAALADTGEFTGGPTTPIEIFSGDGYRQIFYNPDGTRIGGGVTFASGGGETRKKPVLTAADGVSTTVPVPGLDTFFGTSAAAPHAAAIAGLLKSANPRLNPNRIRKALVNGALDIEAVGDDRDSGAGIVSAFNSLVEAGIAPAVFLELGAVTLSAPVNPGGSGQLSIQLVNNGGAAAGVVKGTLSSTTPGVTITQANSNYPGIAPGGSGTNLTPFAFTLAGSAPCGTKIVFQLSVTFVGKGTSPTVLSFSVQTGTPASTATTFSYSGPVVPIPDADPAGVNIPLAVALGGSVSNVSFRIDGATCTADIGATTVGVDHTWVGDLIFKLTSPSGTTVTVISQAGGALNSGNNFCQTVLDDAATASIQNVAVTDAPFTGTFTPANPQAAFGGDSADGNWILNVSDNAGFDTGSVRAFSLDLTGFSCGT